MVIMLPVEAPSITVAPPDSMTAGSDLCIGVIDSPASCTEDGSISLSLIETDRSPIDVRTTAVITGGLVSADIFNTTEYGAISLNAKS